MANALKNFNKEEEKFNLSDTEEESNATNFNKEEEKFNLSDTEEEANATNLNKDEEKFNLSDTEEEANVTNFNKDKEKFNLSDTEKKANVTTHSPKIIPTPASNKNNDVIGTKSDKRPKKYKPCPKSKKKFVYIDDNDEEPINIEPKTTLDNNASCSPTIKRKRRPGPKSKTKFVDDIVPSNTENKNY